MRQEYWRIGQNEMKCKLHPGVAAHSLVSKVIECIENTARSPIFQLQNCNDTNAVPISQRQRKWTEPVSGGAQGTGELAAGPE